MKKGLITCCRATSKPKARRHGNILWGRSFRRQNSIREKIIRTRVIENEVISINVVGFKKSILVWLSTCIQENAFLYLNACFKIVPIVFLRNKVICSHRSSARPQGRYENPVCQVPYLLLRRVRPFPPERFKSASNRKKLVMTFDYS